MLFVLEDPFTPVPRLELGDETHLHCWRWALLGNLSIALSLTRLPSVSLRCCVRHVGLLMTKRFSADTADAARKLSKEERASPSCDHHGLRIGFAAKARDKLYLSVAFPVLGFGSHSTHETGSRIEVRDDTHLFHQTRANMSSGDQFVHNEVGLQNE